MKKQKIPMDERLLELRKKGVKVYSAAPSEYNRRRNWIDNRKTCIVCEGPLKKWQKKTCSHKCATIYERVVINERSLEEKWKRKFYQARLTITKLKIQLKNSKKK